MPDDGNSGRTLDEVYDLVANGFDGLSSVDSDGFVAVGNKLDDVISHIQSLQEAHTVTGEAATGTIALDQAQIDLLHQGIEVVTTETFLLVVLLAVLCGLTGWMIFSHGWQR